MTAGGDGTLNHSKDTERSVATFPAITMPNPPKVVALTAAGKTAILKGESRQGAEGHQIRVSSGCLAGVDDGTVCSFKEATARQYRLYWLLHDPGKQRALLGFGLGLIGLGLDLALGIGKVITVIIVGDSGIVATMVVGGVLKGLGLVLVFVGVYSSDT